MFKQDKSDFLLYYNPIHAPFYRFCRAVTGNIEDTEDLLQESIVVVLEGMEKIRDKTAFKSYLFSVASNLWKMKQRRNKFNANFNEREFIHIVDIAQNQENMTDFNIVYEKILSLPRKTAETLILYHISDLSLNEIQKIQGGSLSGVKLRLKRGREKLLTMLNSPKQVKLALMLLTM